MIKLMIVFLVMASLVVFLSSVWAAEKAEKATFAGGCFWCLVAPFEELEGVKRVEAGYTGGTKKNPTYHDVSSGNTGHFEAIEITYDPEKVTYGVLLDVFWKNIDPTDAGGSFADRGDQYKTAIFYRNSQEREWATQSKEKLEKGRMFSKPIVTAILPFKLFYRAEEYHQAYYKKNPAQYNQYKRLSGREDFIKKHWQPNAAKGKESRVNKIQKLTPLQCEVTQNNGTEPAFRNEYWDNHQEGIYVDLISGEPLFSSKDKFESGTGWPSFSRPLEPENLVEKEDRSLSGVRTEVRSKAGNSHLGHVFNDGPKPTGQRYCMNSASLRFVPKAKLKEEGYGQYLTLFDK